MTITPTWRPDGGPEAVRQTWAYTGESISRFRAHRISGGHQKWPDQSVKFDGDWYVRPPRKEGEAALRKMRDGFRSGVADAALFDKLIADDGRCGGADWMVDGVRVTSTSIWSAYYACRISELTAGLDIESVVDLGGGYGHLADMLAGLFPSVTLVEQPEVLRLAERWTDRVKLCMPDDDWRGDLLINTMSMQHMTPSNLAYYDAKMRQNPPKCLYLVNRRTKRDRTDTPIQDYPFLPLFDCLSERMLTDRHVEWFGVR